MLPARLRTLFIPVVVGCLTLPQIAHAYLDLGSGSYLVQIVIATIVGGLYAVRLHVRRLFGMIGSFVRRLATRKRP